MLGAICGSAISMDLLAQSMDPYSAQKSMDCADIYVDRATRSMNFAYDTILLAQTYMDGLVISTNLKLNNFTYFNGPLQSTEQNHRPSASERLHGRRSRQVPAVILLLLLTSASHRIRGE